jgi:glycosyltransferase involved in cell wall biosynthesis
LPIMFSILILTYNESDDLAGCLKSISWCDDIVVLDSHSTDDTGALAKKAGARVFERKFDDFAGQRNYGLEEIKFKHEWVFHLDADEHFTDALKQECEALVASNENSGYLVPSKMILWGKWLKHAAAYPVYQMRFHRLGEIHFEQFGHGQREAGALRGVGVMKEPYEHHSFSKGLSKWFDRHNRYSTQEAEKTLEDLALEQLSLVGLMSSNVVTRRRTLRNLSFRLPGRPFLRFAYQYFYRRGFLDGRPGLAYCMLLALYERQICLKVMEVKWKQRRARK